MLICVSQNNPKYLRHAITIIIWLTERGRNQHIEITHLSQTSKSMANTAPIIQSTRRKAEKLCKAI